MQTLISASTNEPVTKHILEGISEFTVLRKFSQLSDKVTYCMTRWASVSGYENGISERWWKGGAGDELSLRLRFQRNFYLSACLEPLDYELIGMWQHHKSSVRRMALRLSPSSAMPFATKYWTRRSVYDTQSSRVELNSPTVPCVAMIRASPRRQCDISVVRARSRYSEHAYKHFFMISTD